MFGYEIYPAFSIDINFYWNAAGVKVYGIEAGTQTAGINVDYRIIVLTTRPKSGKSCVSTYFWPYPLTLGVRVMEF